MYISLADVEQKYISLADVEQKASDRDKAVAALEQGLKAMGKDAILLWWKANLLIDNNKLTEAETAIDALRAADFPNYSRQGCDYLNARKEFSQEHWKEAREGFEKVRGALVSWPPQGVPSPASLIEVDFWIGVCYGQAGEYDQQLQAYRRVLGTKSDFEPARRGVINALHAAGRLDEAVEEYRRLPSAGGMSPAIAISLARTMIAKNLRSDSAAPDWKPAEKILKLVEDGLLEKAKQGVLEQAEQQILEVQIPLLGVDILFSQKKVAEAKTRLQEACDKHPKQADLWAASPWSPSARRTGTRPRGSWRNRGNCGATAFGNAWHRRSTSCCDTAKRPPNACATWPRRPTSSPTKNACNSGMVC